jgi:hypothetical protein
MNTLSRKAGMPGTHAQTHGAIRLNEQRGRRAETAGSSEPLTADRIRARAYEIYLTRDQNGQRGDAVSDWLEAERELGGSPERADLENRERIRGDLLLASGE